MTLPADFHFSQANLSDYVDCPRRFQLRYVLQQPWPAIEAEPLLERERVLALGQRFHKLIQQHNAGLPAEVLSPPAHEVELRRWWQAYLHAQTTTLRDLPADQRAEVALALPFNGQRLIAHCDLIAADDERVIIVDWKTEQRRPTRDQLLNRLQTRVYRYVVTRTFDRAPGAVTMLYWFAHYPDQPEVLPYDAAHFAADERYLTELITEIAQQADRAEDWPLTFNERKCAYCTYRSWCNRGRAAGVIDPHSDEQLPDINFHLADLDEIEY